MQSFLFLLYPVIYYIPFSVITAVNIFIAVKVDFRTLRGLTMMHLLPLQINSMNFSEAQKQKSNPFLKNCKLLSSAVRKVR